MMVPLPVRIWHAAASPGSRRALACPALGALPAPAPSPLLGTRCCIREEGGGLPQGPPLLPAQLQPRLPLSLLRASPAGSPSPCSRPQGCSLPPWGPRATSFPPPARPKIAAFQQVLWFLMACFFCWGRGEQKESPSPALCPSPATLCGAGAVTPGLLAPLFTPAPRKWRCLGLRRSLPGAWVARGAAALAAPLPSPPSPLWL